MYAILLVVVAAAIYFGIKEFPQGKDAANSSNNIDYYNPLDSLTGVQLDGKRIFQSQCASCHLVFKNATGPALSGVTERGPWSDSIKLYSYIRKPELFSRSKYIDSLRKMYGSTHMAFPELIDDEISAILRYINVQYRRPVADIID